MIASRFCLQAALLSAVSVRGFSSNSRGSLGFDDAVATNADMSSRMVDSADPVLQFHERAIDNVDAGTGVDLEGGNSNRGLYPHFQKGTCLVCVHSRSVPFHVGRIKVGQLTFF